MFTVNTVFNISVNFATKAPLELRASKSSQNSKRIGSTDLLFVLFVKIKPKRLPFEICVGHHLLMVFEPNCSFDVIFKGQQKLCNDVRGYQKDKDIFRND